MTNVRFSDLCTFHERQWLATEAADNHKFTLYGGARGPGKSHWLRYYPVRFLLRCAAQGLKGVRVGLFCEDYTSLKDRHITKIATTFPDWLGRLQTSKSDGLSYTLAPRYGGGIMALRNLDDPKKYKSSEYALIAVDELTMNPESTFHALHGSLRWPGISETKFIAASNPDGPGQQWVRRFWIENELPAEMARYNGQFAFVPGRAGDNPYLDGSYMDTLESLPEMLRRAWLEGDWYVTMVGLVYGDTFSGDNIEAREPDPAQPIELGFDDGYIDPRAILFIQRTGTEILIFDELYHSKHLAETCVQEVVEKCERNGWQRPELAVGSPEAKEMQQRLRMADIPYRSLPHKIIQGIDVVRRLMKDANGYRAIKIHPRCKNLIRELSQDYRYPETGTRSSDEVPIDENNHAADALRYWCWLRARN